MEVREVMSSPATFLRPDVPAHVAERLLRTHGLTTVPVVDDDERVVGIVTADDLPVPVPDGGQGEDPEPAVGDLMREALIVGHPWDDVTDVVSLMLAAGIRSVPIVDDDRLVGVLTKLDVLRRVAEGELISQDVWRERMHAASHNV